MMVVTSSRVAENAVCWCEGRKSRINRCSIDLWAGRGASGWFWLDPDEEISEEACIKGDSTRPGELEIPSKVA
jgi:hypothetical protein